MQATLQRTGSKILQAEDRASAWTLGRNMLGVLEGKMPGDVERLGTGERSAWGGGLCCRGHGTESAFNLGYSGKSRERFDQGNEVM